MNASASAPQLPWHGLTLSAAKWRQHDDEKQFQGFALNVANTSLPPTRTLVAKPRCKAHPRLRNQGHETAEKEGKNGDLPELSARTVFHSKLDTPQLAA